MFVRSVLHYCPDLTNGVQWFKCDLRLTSSLQEDHRRQYTDKIKLRPVFFVF
jgi:hypothetical protein